MSAMSELADTIDGTAEWRLRKASEFPDDDRNIKASTELQQLASEVRALAGQPIEAEWEAAESAAYSASDGSDMPRHVSDYLAAIGFRGGPSSGQECVADLIELARAEAKRTADT